MLEDYCHSVEHSIEFQVVFLQHLFGPGVRIVPVLCGPFARSTAGPGRPEDDEGVRRFLGALGELAAARRRTACSGCWAWTWRTWAAATATTRSARVGDEAMAARGGEGPGPRCERIAAGTPAGFWDLVQERRRRPAVVRGLARSTRSCTPSAPPGGDLLRYEQWNIDEHSVVSFAGLAFPERAGRS